MSKKNRLATAVSAQRPRDERPLERLGAARRQPSENGAAKAPAARLTPFAALRALASLRLTVVLLLLSMVLVYAGTLAQVDNGIWQVVDQYFWSTYVFIPLKNLVPRFLLPDDFKFPTLFGAELGIPFVGGKVLGFALLVNLLAAHATRFRLTWKRIGIWMIHGGLILLFVGEVITRERAEEGRMPIEEGHSRNYVEDHRKVELAFVDLSDPGKDRVVAIPGARLKAEARIADPALPVDIEVVRFMANSELQRQAPSGSTNPATRGTGRSRVAVEKAVVSGTDAEQGVDMPSSYIRLIDRNSGKPLGVFLASTLLAEERIDLDGKPYEFGLRFRRTYLPYTLQLAKFEHKVYEGTDKPKDFRSHIHLTDAEAGTERDVEIYMNTPLRYRGKTFYQSGFMDPSQKESRGMRGTILQVVDNPGWVIPYVACTLVGLGLFLHFGMNVTQFMIRQLRAKGATA